MYLKSSANHDQVLKKTEFLLYILHMKSITTNYRKEARTKVNRKPSISSDGKIGSNTKDFRRYKQERSF